MRTYGIINYYECLVIVLLMSRWNCLEVIAHHCIVFSSFFFFRKNYLLLSCATSVRLSVRPSVCPSVRLSVCPSVRLSSVEIISFRGNSLSNRPINLKIGLNVREGVVHVRKV